MTSESPVVLSDDEDYVPLEELKPLLLKFLKEIKAVGDVVTAKRHQLFVNPGLTVADTLIPLPLVPRDAETIKGVCRQAPFGRGEETVVDTSVRNTWELDASQFRLANPDWDDFLHGTLLKTATKKLGLSGLRADLYKLLLYEPGSFFKPHKDSEKAPGMVATMVVCLPSKHGGGGVHLSHAGLGYVLDTERGSDFKLTALAWYADITHEVKPLTSGYRLALTYNLIHPDGVRISASPATGQVDHLIYLLRQWETNSEPVAKLLYPLEHKYSQSSLSLENLKGRDRSICQNLREAGLHTGFAVFLANMDRVESASDYDDDEEDCMDLSLVKTCDGRAVCHDIEVDEEELLDLDCFNRRPDRVDEGAYTGNESMPAKLTYHDTVVVIAPVCQLESAFGRSSDIRILIEEAKRHLDKGSHESRRRALYFMQKVVETSQMDFALHRELLATALDFDDQALYNLILRGALLEKKNNWKVVLEKISQVVGQRHPENCSGLDWNKWFGCWIEGKQDLKAVGSALHYIESLLVRDDLRDSFNEWRKEAIPKIIEQREELDVGDTGPIIRLLEDRSNSPQWLTDWLIPQLSKRGTRDLICSVLHIIHRKHHGGSFGGAADAFKGFVENLTEKLALRISDLPREHKPKTLKEPTTFDYPGKFINLIDEGFSLGLREQMTELLRTSCAAVHKAVPKPKSTTLPSIDATQEFLKSLTATLQKHDVPPLDAIRNMYAALARNVLLGAGLPKPPAPLRGWAHRNRHCTSSCADCQQLNAFLRDPEEQTCKFRLSAPRRRHIEERLPVALFDCRTLRSVLPHVLVVTKRGTEHDDEMRQYDDAIRLFQDRIRFLQCPYVETLLGEGLYRKLVMLQDEPGPTET